MHVKYHCLSFSPSSMPHGTIVALQNVSKIATRSTAHSSNLWYGSTSPYLTKGHCLSESPSSISAKQLLTPGKKTKKKKKNVPPKKRSTTGILGTTLSLQRCTPSPTCLISIKGWASLIVNLRVRYVNSAWRMRIPPFLMAHGSPMAITHALLSHMFGPSWQYRGPFPFLHPRLF